jgi:predicted TIM-barrel fold metal-dependent hydrolase
MDAAGVDCSVLFPTVAGLAGEAFARLLDPELELACVQAYNDWLIEEWGTASERFIPQCIVPLWPPEATVAEIRRAVAMGHRGVVFPSDPMDLREAPFVGEPEWDPVWAVCEELDVPLCLHAGSSPVLQLASPPGLAPIRAEALNAITRPVGSAFIFAMYLMSRVVLRHPRLRVVFAESALSWTMCSLEWADHQFEHDGVAYEGYTHDGVAHEGYELTPYQMFQRQCYFSAWFDNVAPFAPYVGADHILWSTNIPQATSTWPRIQETINRCFKGVTDEVRQQILWRNAANLYKL